MALPRLQIEGEWFEGEDGRTYILRGVNLGGDCKVPFAPNGHTHLPTDFSDHRTVSFVGRPFPLDEAHEHFGRLKAWGFNCLRLLTTWEAVEHEGPGRYDGAYLDYFATLCRMADDYGLHVFVDFHQDVWSRMTGGDGAPGWLFEAVGLDFTKFHAAGAAHVMQYKYDFARGGRQEDRYPTMTWSQNYRYPANALMWTFFFAGRAFCPDFEVDGRNVQDFLQDHYLGAMEAVARKVQGLPNVIGFDSLNEPGSGWVGRHLSYRHVAKSEIDPSHPNPGLAWSPLDGLAVARGLTRTIPDLKVDRKELKILPTGEVRVNAARVPIWREGVECPFERAGAYRVRGDDVEALDEFHFLRHGGRTVTMERDFMGPFFQRVASRLRAVDPDWLLFAELDPGEGLAHGFPKDTPRGTVNASHWYDIVTLATKQFNYPQWFNPFSGRVLEGPEAIENAYTRQLGFIKQNAGTLNDGTGGPTLIGEFGIPYDLDQAAAYKAWAAGDRSPGPWEKHVIALDLMYNAMDTLLISSTQWNYTASNRNDQAVGDGWNQEDLSIYSADQRVEGSNDINNGGRALEGFVRPYARATAGRPLKMKFKRETGAFRYVYEAKGEGETDIFVPKLQYPNGFSVEIEGGTATRDEANQSVRVRADGPGKVGVTISRVG